MADSPKNTDSENPKADENTETIIENETPASFNPSVSDELKDEDYKKIKGINCRHHNVELYDILILIR